MTGWIISFRSSLWSQLPGDTKALIEKVLTSSIFLHTCLQSPEGKHRFRPLPMASLGTCWEIPSFHTDDRVLSE